MCGWNDTLRRHNRDRLDHSVLGAIFALVKCRCLGNESRHGSTEERANGKESRALVHHNLGETHEEKGSDKKKWAAKINHSERLFKSQVE